MKRLIRSLPVITFTIGMIGGGWFGIGSQPMRAAEPEAPSPPREIATFAGGCFWCVEAAFEHREGVLRVTSGYTGGTVANPSYQQVSKGNTGHFEAVEIEFDPEKISYERLLYIFWRNIDPLQTDGQFCDRGDSYRSAIFVQSQEQRRLAEKSQQELQKRFNQPIATPILEAAPFYPAEDYHQDYHRTNPLKYKLYRYGCGRDAQLERRWGVEARAEQ